MNEFIMKRVNYTTNTERRRNWPTWPKLNQLLFDFGMSSEKLEEDVEYVKSKIVELDRQFDLGLFAAAYFSSKNGDLFARGVNLNKLLM